MNDLFFNDYFIIKDLCKYCNSTQIINYFNNYENKEQLGKILEIEDIFGNNIVNIILRNEYISINLVEYIQLNFKVLNKCNIYKLYPLNYGIEFFDNKNRKIVKLLIDDLNDKNIKDINDNNLYHQLVIVNKPYSLNFIKYLFYKYKLYNYNNRNKLGFSPILYSCDINNTEIFNFLIQFSDYNLNNHDKNTCLMYACINNNLNIINKLLQKNVDINFLDNQSNTAISYLCGYQLKYNCDIDIIKLLVDKGANINIISNKNNNLLIYSTGVYSKNKNFKINIEVIKYLLKLNLNPFFKNNHDKCFIDYLFIQNKTILINLINENLIKLNNDLKYYYLYNIVDKNNFKIKKEKINSECIICYDLININQEYLKCDNKHYYHVDCLIKWFKKDKFKLKCPTCKINYNFGDKIYINN